jgi:thioredoxin-like negative regulator of GroEL
MRFSARYGTHVLALALALAPAVSAPAQQQSPPQEISWRTDYNRARQEATEQGRPLVLDFTTENCFWCRQLESRTFVDPEVMQLLTQRCIPIRVDVARNPQLAQSLNIQTYPTLVYASPDGKILGYHEGFLEAPKFKEHIRSLIAAVSEPDWMGHDYREALQAQAGSDFARAIALLRHVLEDGKDRPTQQKARKSLQEIESQAAAKIKEGRDLIEQGRASDGYEIVRSVVKTYRGTPAAREGEQMLVMLTSRVEGANLQRSQRAKDLLAMAKDDYRSNQFVSCIDRCELLIAQYPELPEGTEARQLLSDIRADPETARIAADQLADRLGSLYVSMAERFIQRGQPQQAVVYLERVIAACPNTRHAETAQTRLAQIQGPKKDK